MRTNLKDILIIVPAIILVLTIHECAHGLAAYCLGDKTAKTDGRLSLNPLRHIDWFGMISLLVFGFGWAKPVMVDPRNFKNPKVDMALTAAAGPISNIILAFVLMLILVPFALATGNMFVTPLGVHFAPTGFTGWISYFLSLSAQISLSLGFFNMIPIPPLDGSKIFGALLPDRLYVRYMRIGNVGTIVLLVLLYLEVVSKIISPLVVMTGNGMLDLLVTIFK